MSTPVSTTFDGLASVDRYGNLAPIVVDRLDERYPAAAQTGERLDSLSLATDTVGTPLASVGVMGDGATDDGPALAAAIVQAMTDGTRLVADPSRIYRVASNVKIGVPVDGRAILDLNGATVEFVNGGAITLGQPVPTPYLTTTSAAGVKRAGTKVTVAATTGVAVGDLMRITSPAERVAGMTLSQTYLVSDVDPSTGEVWVEGRIAGDISPAQVTAQGKTGPVSVMFYKLADRLEVRNATFVSPGKTGRDTLLRVTTTRHVTFENVHVVDPKRTGIAVDHCGITEAVGCSVRGHGYTTRDRGYASVPTDPEGLGYGYGWVWTNTYSAQARDCNSWSGWHGFDAATGTTYTVWDGCIAHKDAFGFSTHEGAWVQEIRNSQAIGGQGIACRAFELIISGSHIATSLGAAISGQAPLQRLIIKNSILDVSGVGDNAVPFGIIQQNFLASSLSAEKPLTILDGVTIIGATGASGITTSGDVILRGVTIRGVEGTTNGMSQLEINATGGGQRLIVDGFLADTVTGQNVINAKDFAAVELLNVHQRGTVRVGSGAMIYTFGTRPVAVSANACSSETIGFMVRVANTATGNTANVHNSEAAYVLFAGANTTFKNATHNRYRTVLVVGGVAAPATDQYNVKVTA